MDSAAAPYMIGFGLGGAYVLLIFILIHALGWVEQMEQEKQERER